MHYCYLSLKDHYETWGIQNYFESDFENEYYKRQKFFTNSIHNRKINRESLKYMGVRTTPGYEYYDTIIQQINSWLTK